MTMLEYVEICPVCGNKEFDNYIKAKDYTVSGEEFQIVSCNKCSFRFTNPRPDVNTIGNYYQATSYISHSDTKAGLINKIYHQVRSFTLKEKVKLINTLQPKKGKILDVGCGTGYFLAECKKDNWNIEGVEVDPNARDKAKENTSIDIYKSLFEVESKKYSVITAWHVVEHIHLLNESIAKFYNLLESNGNLIIAVPNSNSPDAQTYQAEWAAYDVPRHLYHFTIDTITKLAEKHQFKLVNTKPMKFDAYYVSMLSEKYKYNSSNPIKWLLNGFQSNAKAKNKTNHSSLIYIFKKA